jgi:hypothetical protein
MSIFFLEIDSPPPYLTTKEDSLSRSSLYGVEDFAVDSFNLIETLFGVFLMDDVLD